MTIVDPYRDFETVTYMTDGELQQHQDSSSGGLITDGDAQWMMDGTGRGDLAVRAVRGLRVPVATATGGLEQVKERLT